jgi:hypothetical protein
MPSACLKIRRGKAIFLRAPALHSQEKAYRSYGCVSSVSERQRPRVRWFPAFLKSIQELVHEFLCLSRNLLLLLEHQRRKVHVLFSSQNVDRTGHVFLRGSNLRKRTLMAL